MRRVVITGLGIVSCIGNSKKEVVSNLKELNSGITGAPEYQEFSFIRGMLEVLNPLLAK